MSLIKETQAKCPNLRNQWTISHFLKHTKLTRHLNSDKHWFLEIQEILTSESGYDDHLFKIKSIAPVLMRVEKDLQIDDETWLKQIYYTTSFEFDVKSTSSFYDCIVRVEKTHDHS